MILRHLVKNKNKRKRFAHIGAGIVILIHSYERYESGIDSYILFGIAGLIFLAIAFLHPIIEKKVPWLDGLFFIIEGVLSIIVAIDFFHVGKKALPITFLFVATFQFYMALKKSKKGIELHKLHH
jgi:DNA integrity scanning protein DisA with diadenylate cyclase activity